jgi:hypothetical protein
MMPEAAERARARVLKATMMKADWRSLASLQERLDVLERLGSLVVAWWTILEGGRDGFIYAKLLGDQDVKDPRLEYSV